jgi:hypothetical protein
VSSRGGFIVNFVRLLARLGVLAFAGLVLWSCAVVVEEDCVAAVARTPTMRATNGFDANAKSCSAWPPVATLKPDPMTLTAVIRT